MVDIRRGNEGLGVTVNFQSAMRWWRWASGSLQNSVRWQIPAHQNVRRMQPFVTYCR